MAVAGIDLTGRAELVARSKATCAPFETHEREPANSEAPQINSEASDRPTPKRHMPLHRPSAAPAPVALATSSFIRSRSSCQHTDRRMFAAVNDQGLCKLRHSGNGTRANTRTAWHEMRADPTLILGLCQLRFHLPSASAGLELHKRQMAITDCCGKK